MYDLGKASKHYMETVKALVNDDLYLIGMCLIAHSVCGCVGVHMHVQHLGIWGN